MESCWRDRSAAEHKEEVLDTTVLKTTGATTGPDISSRAEPGVPPQAVVVLLLLTMVVLVEPQGLQVTDTSKETAYTRLKEQVCGGIVHERQQRCSKLAGKYVETDGREQRTQYNEDHYWYQ
jgi:hypothetical protein